VAFAIPLALDGSPGQHPVAVPHRQRQDRERPPPTDLVIAFEHFLI
jgi:hypothetical protein